LGMVRRKADVGTTAKRPQDVGLEKKKFEKRT